MIKKTLWVCLLLSILMVGCDTALTIGNRTVGVTSGDFLYTDGFLHSRYAASFDRVWEACEQMLSDMKATQVKPVRKIAQGQIQAVIQDEKVSIEVEYVARNETTVAIRTGVSGNNLASRMLHERIAQQLAKP
ncbi:MAG: DUF3568 domain-containing protein [Syntrophales bacterium]|jgi:pyruvate-formate lyase-activating enzyme|nr:DUF3568 domain-containing protein [Syntrophales bacterium]MDD4339564.1 DUF3568 family protein [Syntrophales bacterium]HOG08269.1 DUF3568 family protein [Syntrophales bacterium]HOS77467.1 DUF3568 family protein [Syntrophales bacterium]HPB69506.1 DUF3568 family protein [Syntrophales bacterium]